MIILLLGEYLRQVTGTFCGYTLSGQTEPINMELGPSQRGAFFVLHMFQVLLLGLGLQNTISFGENVYVVWLEAPTYLKN